MSEHDPLLHLQPIEPGVVGKRAAQGLQHDGHGRLGQPLRREPGPAARAGLVRQLRRRPGPQFLQPGVEVAQLAGLLHEPEAARDGRGQRE